MKQKILIGLALTLIIAIFIPVYWATESGRQERAQERQEEEAKERGAELYLLNCAICHGGQGEGVVGPALKGNPLSADTLRKIISRGVTGTAMPPFGVEDDGPLKEHQIEDLVTFIKNWDQSLLEDVAAELEVSEVTTTPSQPSSTTAPSIDAAGLYADKCVMCHGKNREGVSGLTPPLTPESLAALSDTEIKNTILYGRPGTAMTPFKQAFNPEQIDALLQFLKYTSP